MKKWVILFVLLFIIYTNKPTTQASTSQKNDIIYYNIEKPLDVYPLDIGYLLQYTDNVVYKTSNNEIKIEGNLKSFVFDKGNLYLITFNNGDTILSKISNNKLESIKLDKEYDIRKICIDNNTIYLFGSNNTFSTIIEYSDTLDFIKQYNYFENAKIIFNDVVKHEDKWYIFGEKYGHTSNSEINNIGNYNDLKSILLIFNQNFEFETIKYFNHNENSEIGSFLKTTDDFIYYEFVTPEYTYLYKSNLIFNQNILIDKVQNTYHELLIDVNNDYLIFNNNNGLIMSSKKENINLGEYNNIYDYAIKNGKLEIIYYNNNNLLKAIVEEYHIDKLNPINIDYDKANIDFSKDLNILEEVEIKSYFSDVLVLCNTEFQKNISGVHNVELLIVRENHDNIKISGQVNVNEYVNVIDGGVYCTGFSLKFLGIGTLNGMKINNGHNILEKGEYQLTITDNLGNISVYNFLIVDEYYKRNEEFVSYDIIAFQNQEVEIKLPFDNILVNEVYVNNEPIEFLKNDNELVLYLSNSNESGIKEYYINKIVTNEMEYKINKNIKVNFLKQIPSIDIIEQNNSSPNLSIIIDDPDQTIRYLEFKLTNTNYTNYIKYCFTKDFVLIDENFLEGLIELYVCYELGDGLIRKELLSQIEGNFKSITDLISLNTTIETEVLKKIDISLDLKKVNKLNNLSVNNQNIVNKYNVKKNYTNLIISSILTVLIVMILVIVLIIRKRKNNKA